jgi:prephenate dehydrogenase
MEHAVLPDAPVEFAKIVIFGVGLIGGSFALALKAVGGGGGVWAGINPAHELADADLALAATPLPENSDAMWIALN